MIEGRDVVVLSEKKKTEHFGVTFITNIKINQPLISAFTAYY
jgi:hypothetical protein